MASFVKDAEVDRLAARHADQPSLVDRGITFTRALRDRAVKDRGVADKPFIDGLYGEP